MVDKILSIKNCGKFVDFVPATIPGGWDGTLKKINTIYAENGMGKTTIAVICSSLQRNFFRMNQKRSIQASDGMTVSLIVANEEINNSYKIWRRKNDNTIFPRQNIDVYNRYYNENLYRVPFKGDLFVSIMESDDIYNKLKLLKKELLLLRQQMKAVKTELFTNKVKYGDSPIPNEGLILRKKLQEQIKTISTNIDKKNNEISKEEKRIFYNINEKFSKYTRIINNYLTEFRTDFRISKVLVHNNSLLTFNASLNGIEINSIKSDDSKRSLEEALSEGDKTALSLAFFFAYLDSLADLDKRIVVFDDPFTSFDSRRKLVTIKKLTEIAQKCEQFFLLSHDLVFVKDFCSEKDNRGALNLRITKKGKTNILTYHQVEIDSMTPLRMMIDSLQKFLEEGDEEVNHMRMIASNIRIIMEGILKEKYFDVMDDSSMLGHFLDLIKSSSDTKYPYLVRMKTYLSELNLLNDYSKKYHHSNPGYLSVPISYAELEGMVEKTLDLIHYL